MPTFAPFLRSRPENTDTLPQPQLGPRKPSLIWSLFSYINTIAYKN